MKSPALAAILNFLLPGAGLVYLGRLRAAIANFALALVGPLAWVALIESGFETAHFVALAIAAGSAGFAHAMAGKVNDTARPAPPPPGQSEGSSAPSSG